MDENKEKEVKQEEVKAEEVKKEEPKKVEKAKVENVKKDESKKESKFEKTTTTETKPNFFKAHLGIIITCVVIALVAVAAIFIFMNNKSGSPEDIFKTYVEAMKEGSSDKIMDMTDVKGALAWSSCGRKPEKFIDEYNSITNEKADEYKETAKNSLDSAMSIIKAFGGVEINLKNIETPVDLGNNLYKVKGNITMKVLGMEQDQTITLVTYNGKYIGEMYD